MVESFKACDTPGDALQTRPPDREGSGLAVVASDVGVLKLTPELGELKAERPQLGDDRGLELVENDAQRTYLRRDPPQHGTLFAGARRDCSGERTIVGPPCRPVRMIVPGGVKGVHLSDAIIIEGVTKTFGPKLAVDNLSLRVPEGSLTGVIGPNGAGKTTTIRMIMSIIFPDTGRLSVLGKASAVESKDQIGYLPEERGLYRKMKVGALLTYLARLKGIDSGAASRKTANWLGRVGLGDVAKKRCEELSKGMQQKVQFIAAVIHEPQLLILDEVFSGLDPVNRRLMRELIDEQHRRGCTILFSTHAMYEAEQLCDRILMIHRGRKALDMTLDQVWRQYDPRSIVAEPLAQGERVDLTLFLGMPGVASARSSGKGLELSLSEGFEGGPVMATLATTGLFRSVSIKRPNLEDIFINLVGADAETLEGLKSERELSAAGVNGGGK